MPSPLLCPLCETGTLTAGRYSDTIRGVRIVGLEYHTCDSCEATPIFTDQIRRNQTLIVESVIAERVLSALMGVGAPQDRTALRSNSLPPTSAISSHPDLHIESQPVQEGPLTI